MTSYYYMWLCAGSPICEVSLMWWVVSELIELAAGGGGGLSVLSFRSPFFSPSLLQAANATAIANITKIFFIGILLG